MSEQNPSWRRRATLTGSAIVALVTLGVGALWVEAPMDYYFGVLLGILVTTLAWWVRP